MAGRNRRARASPGGGGRPRPARARAETGWLANYDRVEGLRSQRVIELEVGGGNRLLAHVSGSDVTLVAFGDHSIVRRYVRGGTLDTDLRDRLILPSAFRIGSRDPLFPPFDATAPPRLTPWRSEQGADWLYF